MSQQPAFSSFSIDTESISSTPPAAPQVIPVHRSSIPRISLGGSRHVAFGDQHFPYQDDVVINLFLDFIADYRPAVIHILGDVLDLYDCSHFTKQFPHRFSLAEEVAQGKEFLRKVRETCPNARIAYSEGNHELRLPKYIDAKAEEFSKLDCLTVPVLMDLAKLRISWWPQERPYMWGKLLFTHGTVVRKDSAMSAKASMEQFGTCIVMGHTHRLGMCQKTICNDTFGGWEAGCGIDRSKITYCSSPNWQNGWLAIDFVGDEFRVDTVGVIHGQYIWNGEKVGAFNASQGCIVAPDMSQISDSDLVF